MGPRSDDRGILKLAKYFAQKWQMLQWGRDQMIAEFDAGDAASLRGERLQWGRDQMIAEFSIVTGRATSASWLQWGRDQMIAEF